MLSHNQAYGNALEHARTCKKCIKEFGITDGYTLIYCSLQIKLIDQYVEHQDRPKASFPRAIQNITSQ